VGAIERERGQTEREALEARVHQAERLEAIGALAGGIALNNILGAILWLLRNGIGGVEKAERPASALAADHEGGKARVTDKAGTIHAR
jgi:hypothetical protein